MPRLELLPFDESHVPDAGGCSPSGTAATAATEPRLSAGSRTRPPRSRGGRRLAWADGASGAVAFADGRLVGYLLGAPKAGPPWGPNLWVESAGQAVSRRTGGRA